MTPIRKNRRRALLRLGLALIFFGGPGTALAASVQVDLRGALIAVQARQASLLEVMTAVADRTGITFETSDPLSETVSLDFKDLTLEECIRRLLGNRNYSLVFEKDAHNAIVLKSIRITGAGLVTRVGAGPATRVQPAPALPQPGQEVPSWEDAKTRNFRKEWLMEQLEDSTSLERQIRVRDPEDNSPDGGVRVTRIHRRSVLGRMGIRRGDVILNVNGTQIQSAQGLVEAIKSASREGQVIRIERKLRDGRIDPIQIEIQ